MTRYTHALEDDADEAALWLLRAWARAAATGRQFDGGRRATLRLLALLQAFQGFQRPEPGFVIGKHRANLG